MPDRGKVIKGLECCMSKQICRGCPYKDKDECEDGGYYYSKAIEDALALLKDQPEVVRCKDCKHGAPTIINGVWLSVTCGDVDHRPEWFCADGERGEWSWER